MSRTLLCTTGTSIARKCPALDDYQKRGSSWEEDTAGLAAEIRERLRSIDLSSPSGRIDASAELNALHRLGATADDEVVLLATDTADGRACAEALKGSLTEAFGISRVIIERIEGLQVRDEQALRRLGLANLTRRLAHYLDDPQRRYGGGCVLCPNGGFKGVVPFLTVLGMIYRAPVVYVFEFSDALIQLPPLPIGVATDLFERALPALRWASGEEVFDPQAFYRHIPGFSREEEDWFGSFLESVDMGDGQQLASVSPLARILALREDEAGEVLMLSPLARKEYDELNGSDRQEVADHLRKLTSPLWRSQHRDTKHTNDLDFYPRGHNPWRFAGYLKDGLFHLCWFARHDEYERRMPLPAMQKASFAPGDFSRHDLEMVTPTLVDDSDPDATKSWSDLRKERDDALERLRIKSEEASNYANRTWQLEKEIRELREKNQQ